LRIGISLHHTAKKRFVGRMQGKACRAGNRIVAGCKEKGNLAVEKTYPPVLERMKREGRGGLKRGTGKRDEREKQGMCSVEKG